METGAGVTGYTVQLAPEVRTWRVERLSWMLLDRTTCSYWGGLPLFEGACKVHTGIWFDANIRGTSKGNIFNKTSILITGIEEYFA